MARVVPWKKQKDAYLDALNYIRDRKDGLVKSIQTPWSKFNDATVDGLEWNSVIVIAGRPSAGKAQPLYSKVYTKEGFKLMKDIKPGDSVIGADGLPKIVIQTYPQGKKKTYRLYFSDNTTVDCCEDHLWSVSTQKLRKKLKNHIYKKKKKGFLPLLKPMYTVLRTKEMINNIEFKEGNNIRYNYGIPFCKPVHFKSKFVKLEPYFLGLLLGDGGMTGKSLALTTVDEEILNSLNKEISKDPDYKLRKEKITYFITKIKRNRHIKNKYITILEEYGLMGHKSSTKFIPDDYLYNDIPTRLAILQGLLDTDGTVSVHGMISYTSASKLLAEGVAELARSLGWSASISNKYNKKYERYYFDVAINYTDNYPPFRLTRKLKRCKIKRRSNEKFITKILELEETEQKCILIDSPDHLYLTDGYTVTHNTTIKDQIIREVFPLNQHIEFKVLEFQFEMVGRTSAIRQFSSAIGQTYKHICSADGTLTDEEFTNCYEYAKTRVKMPIDIVDDPCTVNEIKEIVSQWFESNAVIRNGEKIYTPGIVTLDHSILVRKASFEKDKLDTLYNLGEAITEQKKKYPLIWIILSQLNRDVDKAERNENAKQGNYIIDSDIFGADALLQHADTVVAFNRPGKKNIRYYGPDQYIIENDKILVAHFLKARNGDTRMSFFKAEFEKMMISEIPTPPQAEKKNFKQTK